MGNDKYQHLKIYHVEAEDCQHDVDGFFVNSFGNSIQCSTCGSHLSDILRFEEPGGFERWLEFHKKRPDLIVGKIQ